MDAPLPAMQFGNEREEVLHEVILPTTMRSLYDFYDTGELLGGSSSSVVLGKSRGSGQRVVIKRFENRSLADHEKCVLNDLKRGPNIIRVLELVKDPAVPRVALVLQHYSNLAVQHRMSALSANDVRRYVRQLLRALNFCHSNGIIHRNVSPDNMIIDIGKRVARLADMRCAVYYAPGASNATAIGEMQYRAPELLLEYDKYDYSVDMWSVGVMLAGLIFRCEHVYRGYSSVSYLCNIAQLLGGRSLDDFLTDNGLQFPLSHITRAMPKQPWTNFVNTRNMWRVSPELYDLLDQLLEINPDHRISAVDAVQHPFFLIDRQPVAFRLNALVRAIGVPRPVVQSGMETVQQQLGESDKIEVTRVNHSSRARNTSR